MTITAAQQTALTANKLETYSQLVDRIQAETKKTRLSIYWMLEAQGITGDTIG